MSYMELFYPAIEQSSWTGSNSDSSYNHSYGRSYQSSAVVLHVSMCCEKCVEKVRKALANVDDVEAVEVEMDRQKVIVRGYVDPERVLRKVRKVKKTATYWDSSHDYANYSAGAYDYHGSNSSPYDYNTSSYDYNQRSPSSYDYNQRSPSSYDPYSHTYSRNYHDSYDQARLNNRRQSSYDAYRYR